MDGIHILYIGAALIIAAVILFTASMIYHNTAGRRIRRKVRDGYSFDL